jgi:glycosyltransferase involved in cell wall biosynthesis
MFKVSIITVSYNSESTIGDTLGSILNQTYPDIESIVIDGASTDNTLNIIKEFEPKFNGRMKWISEPATNIQEWGNEIAKELNTKIFKVPYFIFKLVALCGDVLALFGLHIPMSSYRLKNMIINNIIDLTNTYNIAPHPPFSRIEGVRRILKWMNLFISK